MTWNFHTQACVVAVLIFASLPTMTIGHMTKIEEGNETTTTESPAQSYFRESTASRLLYTHITLMILSWVVALPVSIMLNIARSDLRYRSQSLFLGLHTVGSIFGLAYNSKTPDLYPNNSHSKLGNALSGIVAVQFIIGLITGYRRTRNGAQNSAAESAPFLPLSTVDVEGQQAHESFEVDFEPSTTPNTSPHCSPLTQNSQAPPETDEETLFDVPISQIDRVLAERFNEPMSWGKRWANVSGTNNLLVIFQEIYAIIDKALLLLGFMTICTGIVTLAGIFHGKHVFNGLAHFIKGGVFFWYGIATLGRWMGCFGSLGWAWNQSPPMGSSKSRKRLELSMEAVESFIIFLYGITNVFLEHLSAWGEAWAPQDFEHVAISLLFIGGGVCGLMVESKALRRALNLRPSKTSSATKQYPEPRNMESQEFGVNPIPVMIIFLLGRILGGHHQKSVESTMMHKSFGNLLTGAAAARCVTYLIMYISPPTSPSPSRPPSELVSSFCLICGGIVLMLSNRDTVDAMIENNINAMLVTTVAMGITAVLMAWEIFVVAVGGWAEIREVRYRNKLEID